MGWGWIRDIGEKIIDVGEDAGEVIIDTGEKIIDVGEDAGEKIIDTGEKIIDVGEDAGEKIIDAGKDAGNAIGEGVENATKWTGGTVIDGVNYIGDVDEGLLKDLSDGSYLVGDTVVGGANDVGNFFEYFGTISQRGARQGTVDSGPTGIVDESVCNEMEYFEWNRDTGLCQIKNNEDLNNEDLFRECINVAGNVVFEGFDDDRIDQPQTSGSMLDVVDTFVDQGLEKIPELPMTNVEELQGLNTTATDTLEGVFESMTDNLSWREKMDDESWVAAYKNMNREEAQAYANSKTKFDYKGKYRVKPEVGFPVITNTRMADTKTNFIDAFMMCSRRCTQNIYPQSGGGLTDPHVDPEHYCRGFSIIYKPSTKTYTCEQYKTHDNSDTKWRSGSCQGKNADIAGECRKLDAIESNPEDDNLGNNSGLYWRVDGLDVERAELGAKTVEISPLSLENIPRPPPGVDIDQYIEDFAEKPALHTGSKYKQELSTEISRTTDVFHLYEGTNPKGTLKNCLEKCDKRVDCKGIVTNKSHSKCWGKKDLTTRRTDGDRTLYEKSDDGVWSPWDGGVEWSNHVWNPSRLPPAPPMSTEFTRLGEFRLSPGKSGYPYSQFYVDNPANAVEECKTACKDNSNCPGFSLDWHQDVDKVNCMVYKSNTGGGWDQSCVNEPFGAHCRYGVTGKPGVTEGGMWWRGTRTSQ